MAGKRAIRTAVLLLAGASLAACATTGPKFAARPTSQGRPAANPTYKVGAPYQVGGVWYVPREQPNYNEVGIASWYGDQFHMKATANGEIFDKDVPSAAHTTLPLPSLVEVTNLANGKKLVVRVNDRGPFVDGRIIDLSHEAARELGYDRQGLARVRVRYIGPAPLYGEDTRRFARYSPPKAGPRVAGAPPPPKPTPSPASDLILTATPAEQAQTLGIAQSVLAPLPSPANATRSVASVAKAAGYATEAMAAPGAFRVQAGAFSSQASAQRAAARLASAGAAVVEPVSRNGMTLYRVMIDGASDQDEAEELRQKVAEIGFSDARVLRPF